MHVILCDLCMYDHEKKIVLLAQNVEEKKEEKRSSESEKNSTICARRRPSSRYGLLKNNPQIFFWKKITTKTINDIDDTEMFFLYNTVDICGHYIFFRRNYITCSDIKNPVPAELFRRRNLKITTTKMLWLCWWYYWH